MRTARHALLKKCASFQVSESTRLFAMLPVRNENLSATMEAFFSTPAAFDRTALQTMAATALQQFSEYGLRPSQINQRLGDQLFDYEVSFSLFNNQAHFRVGSERLFVNVQNARGQRDAQLLAECIVRATKCVDSSTIGKLNFQAASHAVFENEADYAPFFSPFVDATNAVIGGGRIILAQEKDWPAPVRLLAENSLNFKDGVFLLCSTEHSGVVSLEALHAVADRFGKTAQKLGLKIRFAE